MKPEMSIGILITNYNTWGMTCRAIENCLRYADSPVQKFVVVDDNSTESFENSFGDKIDLVKNEKNLGLTRSLNKGLAILQTDLVIIFDSDAWPLENYVSQVKAYFNRYPETGIAAFSTENTDGQPSAAYEAEPGAMSIILGQKLHEIYRKLLGKKNTAITVYTCAIVIRRAVLEQIGNFDEHYDWLELDNDFCMRATRSGWNIGVMPIKAFHKGSGTAQKVSHRVIRFHKNRWYLLTKFKKIKYKNPVAVLICTRLSLEYVAILLGGILYYRKMEIVKDKLLSRQQLLKYFFLKV
jgi:GT2 family glycosyltransferase